MQYNSVSEYFARLHAKSLIFLFASVLAMVVLIYLLVVEKLTFVMPNEEGKLIGYVLTAAAWADAATSFALVALLLKKTKTLAGLGERMDRYVTVFYVRFALLCSGALMLMIAFFICGKQWIVILFAVYLLNYLFSWPTRSRLSSELSLRESEREVVFDK